MQNINLPAGAHEEVLLGERRVLVQIWSAVSVHVDRDVLTQYHSATGIDAVQAFEILAYAHVAKAAYGLTGAAIAVERLAEFDPDEVGHRCAAIAREQIDRCSQAEGEACPTNYH